MLIGLVDHVVPSLAVNPLVLATVVGQRLWFGDENVSNLGSPARVMLTYALLGVRFHSDGFWGR